jgi:hypothetical protein
LIVSVLVPRICTIAIGTTEVVPFQTNSLRCAFKHL